MVKSPAAPVVIALLSACAVAHSAIIGYWRHEEGGSGALIPAGGDTVLDSSGNGNHMQTFDPTFTSATYTDAVSPRPLLEGMPNLRALNFGPGGDDPGRNDDNYTDGKLINFHQFTALTIELAFNMNTVGGYQALFGKDGKPLGDGAGEPNSPVPPLKIMIRGDDFPDAVPNQLFVEFVDGDATLTSDIHFLASRQTIAAGQWYHVAFTLTPSTAELWVAGESGDYARLDSISGDFAGAAGQILADNPGAFTIGRGMFNLGVTDWSDARIDEVRVSDTLLTPDQFLFAIPEPSLTMLAATGALALGVARRNRARDV